MPIVVLRTGDAVAEVAARRGEFSSWIAEHIGDAWTGAFSEHDARSDGPLPTLPATAIIVTGSSASVTERAAWMLRAEAWLREAVALDVPVLGICFGHQLLAQALGGMVALNTRGREIGTVSVTGTTLAASDALFGELPGAMAFNATHVDTVVTLPPGAELLAHTPLERHAAFRVGRRAYGVQFHPEADGDILRGYVRAREPALRSEGLAFEAIRDGIHDAPHGPRLLRSFVRNVVGRSA